MTKHKTCRKCEAPLKSYIKVDGKWKKLVGRSFCLDCSPLGTNGNHLRKEFHIYPENQKDIYKTIDGVDCRRCKICSEHKPLDEFYKKKCGKLDAYCKKCKKIRDFEISSKCKQVYVDYKGGKCEICGYSDCLAALDFHHKDRSKKDFKISDKNKNQLDKKILDELDKCLLVCSNCHAEIHGESENENV